MELRKLRTEVHNQGTPIAPGIYYQTRNRRSSKRRLRDEQLRADIARVHEETTTAEKIHYVLHTEHLQAGEQIAEAYGVSKECVTFQISAGSCARLADL